MRAAIGFALIYLCSLARGAETPPFRLPENVQPLRYAIDLRIIPEEPTFAGKAIIDIEIRQPTSKIWLHSNELKFDTAEFEREGKSTQIKVAFEGDNHALLALNEEVPKGRARLSISYTGTINAKNPTGVFSRVENGQTYVSTLFEPLEARKAFPGFDEPRFKTPWQITLRVKKGHEAFSNASLESSQEDGDMNVLRFRETQPLPTYLVAFAVGPWEIVNAGALGSKKTPARIIVPKGRGGDTEFARSVISRATQSLEAYFGIAYPYDKLDLVGVPSIAGSGMEHAGLISYDLKYLAIRKGDESIVRRRENVEILVHELGHQWFGNLVTTKWWNDIWLNEGFTQWLHMRIAGELFPEWNFDRRALAEKHFALEIDSVDSARRIAQPIENHNDIQNAFDGTTYMKGAAVIQMFENWLGPEVFRQAIQSYLKRYLHGSATSSDFLAQLSQASKRDVNTAFGSFLYQVGAPLVKFGLRCSAKESPVVLLSQQRAVPLGSSAAVGQTWDIPICFAYAGKDGKTIRQCTLLKEQAAEVQLTAAAAPCPEWLIPNERGRGYYLSGYSDMLLDKTLRNLDRFGIPDQMEFIGNMQRLMNMGSLPVSKFLEVASTSSRSTSYDIHRTLANTLVRVFRAVPDDELNQRANFFRESFSGLAKQLGMRVLADDDDNRKELRRVAIAMAVGEGRDPELHAQAVELAGRWLADRGSVDKDLVRSVLTAAASGGDAELRERMVSVFRSTKDDNELDLLGEALASFGDPALYRKNLDLVLDEKLDPMDTFGLLFPRRAETRRMGLEFLKANLDRVLARIPTVGGTDMKIFLPHASASLCTTADSEELDRVLRPRLKLIEGGERNLNQVTEEIRNCAARAELNREDFSAYLSRYKRP